MPLRLDGRLVVPDPAVIARLSEVERRAIELELQELDVLSLENPLLGYWPHSAQRPFHESRASLKVIFGGNRAGKTTAGILDDLIQAVDEDCLPAHLAPFKKWQPPFFCRIVIPDLGSTLEEVHLQKLREWCPKSQLQGGSMESAWSDKLRTLRFANGSRFHFMSNDQDLDKFGGAALHRTHYDEQPREDIRGECLVRLVDYGGDEVLTMTPLEGMSAWTYEEIYEPWEKAQENGTELEDQFVALVDMDDNPHLDDGGKQRALARAATPEEREARKTGRFVSFGGRIYNEFSKDDHVQPAKQGIPEGVEVFVGIDPGMRHMCAILWAYLNTEDEMVVFDELPAQGKIIADVCKQIHERNTYWGITPRFYVIDPSSRNKNSQTGRSDQQEFADHGIYTVPGQNAWRPGVDRVRERLQNHRLVVWDTCDELIGEFKKYRFKKKSARSEDDPKEGPVKKDDHLLDCLVAGTMILTEKGDVPIEQVRPGMRVWTRKGLRRVTDAWCANPTASVVRVPLSNGSELIGTADHRVWVEGQGFRPLGAVRYGDTMVGWNPSPSSSVESPTGATRIPRAGRTACTSAPPATDSFTGRYGKPLTARSRTDATSTTLTATRSTTTSAISPVAHLGTTSLSTGPRNGHEPRESTPSVSGHSPLHGTPHRKAGRGIASTASGPGMAVSPKNGPASTAERPTGPSIASQPGSARTSARQPADSPPEWTTRTGCAPSAASPSGSTSTPPQGPVRVSADPRPAGIAAVYDLTVEDAHEFFASGVLVHNCLRYMIMARPMTPKPEHQEPTRTSKDRWLRANLERLSVPNRSHPSGPGIWN